MTEARPLDWIREIEVSLAELDAKPQFGLPAPFKWDQLEKELQELTGHKHLKLSHSVKGWVASNELLGGLGDGLYPLAIEWSPLQRAAFFILGQQTVKDLMSLTFVAEEAVNFFYDPAYLSGFTTYFAAEVLRVIEHQHFATPLAARLGPLLENIKDRIGEESCFVIDVSASVGEKTLWGKILLTESFRKEWKSYFSHLGPPALTEEMKSRISTEVCLEVAHARLDYKQWKKAKAGDFVVLDHCSYDPQEHTGAVVLTLNQKPVFRGRIKDGGIKITNYPIYEEVSDAMDESSFGKRFLDNEDDDDDDEDLYGDLDEDEDSEFEEDEDIFAGLEPRKEPEKKVEEEKVPASLVAAEEGVTIAPAELPVKLTVEIGRVRMRVGDLMNLAPGNLLELNVTPEQGVDLVVNGKKVGRGELIRMGELLGVRILSL